MERQFDTNLVSEDSQLEYWADHVSAAFTNLQFSRANTGDAGFIGKLSQREFGPISIGSASAQDHEVRLTRREISQATEEVLLLHLQYKGRSTIVHAGTEINLKTGDVEICDCTQPYRLNLHSHDWPLHEMLVVRIPLAKISSKVPSVHQLAGAFVSGDSDLGNLLSQFVTNVWERRRGIDDEAAEQLGTQIIDLVTLAFANGAILETPESSVRTGHLVRMKRFIDTHISDAALAPATVAQAASISPRYAYQLFAAEEATISSYIMGRRLERCERMLRSPQHSNLTISEIAHMWGFKDASHFGHVFRRTYGMSPSAFRVSKR